MIGWERGVALLWPSCFSDFSVWKSSEFEFSWWLLLRIKTRFGESAC